MISTQPKRIAFFDVDQTVIYIKSMLKFLDFLARVCLVGDKKIQKRYLIFSKIIQMLYACKISRRLINRFYYYFFKGIKQKDLKRFGETWFLSLDKTELFNDKVVRELKLHQESGDEVVLISGSFHSCLDPIAAYLNVNDIICTQQEIDREGCFTGRILPPQIIGEGKKTAITMFLQQRNIDPGSCFVYADDMSDLPILRLVGNSVVIPSSIE